MAPGILPERLLHFEMGKIKEEQVGDEKLGVLV